jgi:hypothetical protein
MVDLLILPGDRFDELCKSRVCISCRRQVICQQRCIDFSNLVGTVVVLNGADDKQAKNKGQQRNSRREAFPKVSVAAPPDSPKLVAVRTLAIFCLSIALTRATRKRSEIS